MSASNDRVGWIIAGPVSNSQMKETDVCLLNKVRRLCAQQARSKLPGATYNADLDERGTAGRIRSTVFNIIRSIPFFDSNSSVSTKPRFHQYLVYLS
jgi:hypothetical protein